MEHQIELTAQSLWSEIAGRLRGSLNEYNTLGKQDLSPGRIQIALKVNDILVRQFSFVC